MNGYKPYDKGADQAAAPFLQPSRRALRQFIKSGLRLVEHDNLARNAERAYYGPDMELTTDGGQHLAWIEDEVKGFWEDGSFPRNGAHVPTRPMKHKSDLFIQVRADGKAIWCIPTKDIAQCPIVLKVCKNNPGVEESFYSVSEDKVDTFYVLRTLVNTDGEDHHFYLEALWRNL